MDSRLSDKISLRAADGVMACAFGEGLALLHHDSGSFFILDEVGSFIWERLACPVTADAIAGAVKAEYDAAPDQVDCDVRSFVQEMLDAKLIDVEPVVR